MSDFDKLPKYWQKAIDNHIFKKDNSMKLDTKSSLYEDIKTALTCHNEGGVREPDFYDIVDIHDTIIEYYKVDKLQHYKDTTIGLWCTDKPDLISDPKNIMFQLED